ncbi:hypothetical protein D3C78_458970 [compost metagenome]
MRGSAECFFDQGFKAIGLERLDCSFRGARRGGDTAAQLGRVDVARDRHVRSAQCSLQGQLRGDIRRQAQFHAGGGHGLDQQEEIRRA